MSKITKQIAPPNLSGLCQCGCGQTTPLATRNRAQKGLVKGQHIFFMNGHAREIKGPNHTDQFGDSIIIWLERRGDHLPCFIDASDYPIVKGYRWYADKGGYTFYAVANKVGKGCRGLSKIKMHALILPQPSGLIADHEDRNGLNNRRGNLRPATSSQNMQNRKKMSRARHSQYTGVSFQRGKFTASFGVEGRQIFLGCFDSEIEAARAYNEAAQKHFGEFAVLNELPEDDLIFNQKPDGSEKP